MSGAEPSTGTTRDSKEASPVQIPLVRMPIHLTGLEGPPAPSDMPESGNGTLQMPRLDRADRGEAAPSRIQSLPHGFSSTVAVANAEFFTNKEVEGAYTVTAGGLAMAVSGALRGWNGSTVITSDMSGTLQSFSAWKGRPFDAIGVAFEPKVFNGYYSEFSNGALWPVLHGLLEHAVTPQQDAFEHYRTVNAKFAAEIVRAIEPNKLVWIHDYHLMRVPHMVREAAPETNVAYFHHIPFPTPEQFAAKLSPEHQKYLLEGLLGSDLVAFHTMRYVRNFLDTVREANIGAVVDYGSSSVSFGGRTISVGAFPISVDVARIEGDLESSAVAHHEAQLRSKYPNEKILFGVERLDYTKGIKERILAMGELLEEHPELIGNVRLVQYAAPSRESVEAYRILQEEVKAAAQQVNEKFGKDGWFPIELNIRKISQEVIFGYCRAADVVVVTPRVDGMNLVIKEAVLAARDRTAFILGEGAGAAEELREAFLVKGGNVSSIATGYSDALNALTHSPEVVENRARQLKARIREYPVSLWCEELVMASREAVDRRHASAESLHKTGGILHRQVSALISAHSPHRRSGHVTESYASIDDLVAAMSDFGHAKIALDYDGCLVPIVAQPEWARIDRSGIDNLRALAHAKNTEVAIVSGRTVEQLLGFLPSLKGEPILLCGMHGGEIYDLRDGTYLRELDPALKTGVGEFKNILRSELASRGLQCSDSVEYLDTAALRIEDKGFSLALHYRSAPALEGQAKAAMRAAATHGDFSAFEIRHGKMVVELVPRSCSKGNAVEFFFLKQPGSNEFGAMSGADRHLFVAGDDVTDESAFQAARKLDPRAITVRIGDLTTATAARERIPNPETLHSLLLGFTATRW